MRGLKDWRPENVRLDVEALATDAILVRIEAKLDQLLGLHGADETHKIPQPIQQEIGFCNTCGKPVKHYG
jgi:hypothetical protein